jgi:hypothetical protein
MAPDFVHQLIEQAYKAAHESPGAADRFKREYRAKHGGQRYRTCNAPGVTASEPTELLRRSAVNTALTTPPVLQT